MGRPSISNDLWLEAQRLALDLKSRGIKVDASELAELGLRIVIETLREGRPRDSTKAKLIELSQTMRG